MSAASAAPGGALRAAGWMVGAVISFAAMAVAGRELSAELSTFEIMFYRSAIGFPVIALMLSFSEGARAARSAQPWTHVTRNAVHFAAQNFWFYGIATIPLAQLVALEFTNPIWVALLAPLMLGEALTRGKLLAAGLGFLGVLAIAQPGVSPLEAGHGAGLLAAIGFALTNIYTKRMMQGGDSALCVLFWMTGSQLAMALAISLAQGLTLFSAAMTPWVAFVGVCGLTAHMCLTQALRAAPASIVAPMEFARLPVIAMAGLLLYGEPLTAALLLGAALILVGNVVNLREGRGRGAGRGL